jgi:hypothetical protein
MTTMSEVLTSALKRVKDHPSHQANQGLELDTSSTVSPWEMQQRHEWQYRHMIRLKCDGLCVSFRYR